MNKIKDKNLFTQADKKAWEEYVKTGKEFYIEETLPSTVQTPSSAEINNISPYNNTHATNEIRSIAQGNTAGIDRNTAEKLQKGLLPIDITIDLHGSTIDEAYHIVSQLINQAFNNGQRLLLVITGKGKQGNSYETLNKMLPRFLNYPELSNKIIFFDYAQPRHGGQGAYYIYLKRKK